jgi:hypothetical protein
MCSGFSYSKPFLLQNYLTLVWTNHVIDAFVRVSEFHFGLWSCNLTPYGVLQLLNQLFNGHIFILSGFPTHPQGLLRPPPESFGSFSLRF